MKTLLLLGSTKPTTVYVVISKSGVEKSIEGSHLLVAAGRQPNVDELALEKVGIIYSLKGIEVDVLLRTSNKKNST
jgi:pyruvate/2-oxoglutarate dehydrogenase complex dihydrolipoamide dehydrogenase (E3) component